MFWVNGVSNVKLILAAYMNNTCKLFLFLLGVIRSRYVHQPKLLWFIEKGTDIILCVQFVPNFLQMKSSNRHKEYLWENMEPQELFSNTFFPKELAWIQIFLCFFCSTCTNLDACVLKIVEVFQLSYAVCSCPSLDLKQVCSIYFLCGGFLFVDTL